MVTFRATGLHGEGTLMKNKGTVFIFEGAHLLKVGHGRRNFIIYLKDFEKVRYVSTNIT